MSMKYKIKFWHVFLLGILVSSVLSITVLYSYYPKIAASILGESFALILVWGLVGFGINYAIRKTELPRFVIYVIILILIDIGLWIYALNSDYGRGQYLTWAIMFAIVLLLNIIYHSIRLIRKKKDIVEN